MHDQVILWIGFETNFVDHTGGHGDCGNPGSTDKRIDWVEVGEKEKPASVSKRVVQILNEGGQPQ